MDKSKNDPERVGHTVVIAPGKGTKLEPLEQVKMYLRRMEAHPEATHFFHSSRTPYPRLSKKTPNHLIKKWLTKIGVDPKPYGSHSCRKGGATAAASKKICKRVLKRHGNWRSDAVDIYIHDNMDEMLTCSEAILACA